MLPLLPALILLILNSPSNFERMAAEGRLPAMFDAIAQRSYAEVTADQERSLVAAIRVILHRRAPQANPAILAENKPVADPTADIPATPFLESQRSRDGPRA